ncbi:MAG: Gfo/Idh/MocA family oxidoreductase [Candidatus Bathyarchaeota archaeon]|nr:Gfo/Idh/MocA family oxidoreductase [Candidatus Bathyarchaeota archaeon]
MSLKVCLVGCGVSGLLQHIPAWKRVKNASLIAICDSDKDRLNRASAMYQINNCYTDMETMIDELKPAIVDISTPPATHAKLAESVLEAKCNLVVQKPMALTDDDCDKMIDHAAKNNVKLAVTHNLKFLPTYIEAKKIIKSGQIGSIIKTSVSVYIGKEDPYVTNKDHWCHKLRGGVVAELIPHPLYLIRYFIGATKLQSVSVRKSTEYPFLSVGDLRATLDGETALGEIHLSMGSERSAWLVTDIFGAKADLRLINDNVLITMGHNYGPVSSLSTFTKASFGGIKTSIRNSLKYNFGHFYHSLEGVPTHLSYGHYLANQNFVNHILNGEPLENTPQDGASAVRLSNQIINHITP